MKSDFQHGVSSIRSLLIFMKCPVSFKNYLLMTNLTLYNPKHVTFICPYLLKRKEFKAILTIFFAYNHERLNSSINFLVGLSGFFIINFASFFSFTINIRSQNERWGIFDQQFCIFMLVFFPSGNSIFLLFYLINVLYSHCFCEFQLQFSFVL